MKLVATKSGPDVIRTESLAVKLSVETKRKVEKIMMIQTRLVRERMFNNCSFFPYVFAFT